MSWCPPRQLSVRIVSIEPPQPYVDETFSVTYDITYPHRSNSGDCIEVALAVNSKSNIVKVFTDKTGSGYGGFRSYFVLKFSSPGTYTIWVGVKYFDGCVKTPVDYVWSDPATVVVRPVSWISKVVRVVIDSVSSTNINVGDTVTVKSTVYLDSPASGYECFVCAFYVGGVYITHKRFRLPAGVTTVKCDLSGVVNIPPGTYALCVQALTFTSSSC